MEDIEDVRLYLRNLQDPRTMELGSLIAEIVTLSFQKHSWEENLDTELDLELAKLENDAELHQSALSRKQQTTNILQLYDQRLNSLYEELNKYKKHT